MWVRVDTLANNFEIWLRADPSVCATSTDKLTAPDLDQTFEFRTGDGSPMSTFYLKTSGGSAEPNFGPIYIDDIHVELFGVTNLSNPVAPPPFCPGDFDRNGVTDIFDFAVFARNFTLTHIAPMTSGDLDGDGDVDVLDFGIFTANFACVEP
jgi:hypothetical protein